MPNFDKRNAGIAIAVYLLWGTFAFALGEIALVIAAPFIAGFVSTLLSAPSSKEKSAIRSGVLMATLGTITAVIYVSFSPAEIGTSSDDGQSEFIVSIVATVIVNFCVGAMLGGLGGFAAEATRGASSSPPPPSPPPPSAQSNETSQPNGDLRDRWRSR